MAGYFEKHKYIERAKAVQACVSMRKEITNMMHGGGPFHTEDAEKIGNLLKKFEVQVNAVSSADVAPVVHGRWIKIGNKRASLWYCSECKTTGSPQWEGCPVCLARMDGEG